jgi:hypothetical protein
VCMWLLHFVESVFSDRSEKATENLKVAFQDKRNALDWIKRMGDKDGDMLLLYIDQLEILLNMEEIPFSVIQPLLGLLTSKRYLYIYNICSNV